MSTGNTLSRDLFQSCRKGDLDSVRYLVDQRDAEVNQRDRWDSTPLYYACLCGHINVVEFLLSAGARCDANTFDGERCIYGALTTDIRNLLRRKNVTSSQITRREMYYEFLRILLESGEYSDVTFKVHGVEFRAHRCILSARSGYFKESLATRWLKKSVVNINNSLVNPDAFKAVLHYIYTDRLEIETTQVEDVLRLAKYCHLHSLKDRLQSIADKTTFFQRTKPGMRVTSVLVESPHGSVELKSDMSILADCAVPTYSIGWVAGVELPMMFDDVIEENTIPKPVSFHDVIFNVHGHEFACHQMFFCCRSDFFRTCLRDPFHEFNDSHDNDDVMVTVNLRHFAAEIFVYIVYYIYQDFVELDADKVFDVLVAADVCLLPGLKRQCGNYIAKLLDEENVFEALQASRMFNLPRLEDCCYSFMADHIEEIIDAPELHAFIHEDAGAVMDRQDTDTIDIIDQIRYHLTAESIDDAHDRLQLIDALLIDLGLDG